MGELKQREENVALRRSPLKDMHISRSNGNANATWKRPKPLHELRKNFIEKSLSSKVPFENRLEESDIEEEANLIESQMDDIWNDGM